MVPSRFQPTPNPTPIDISASNPLVQSRWLVQDIPYTFICSWQRMNIFCSSEIDSLENQQGQQSIFISANRGNIVKGHIQPGQLWPRAQRAPVIWSVLKGNQKDAKRAFRGGTPASLWSGLLVLCMYMTLAAIRPPPPPREKETNTHTQTKKTPTTIAKNKKHMLNTTTQVRPSYLEALTPARQAVMVWDMSSRPWSCDQKRRATRAPATRRAERPVEATEVLPKRTPAKGPPVV